MITDHNALVDALRYSAANLKWHTRMGDELSKAANHIEAQAARIAELEGLRSENYKRALSQSQPYYPVREGAEPICTVHSGKFLNANGDLPDEY